MSLNIQTQSIKDATYMGHHFSHIFYDFRQTYIKSLQKTVNCKYKQRLTHICLFDIY